VSGLYGDDIVLWSERQASLLRRIAAGERVDDQIDWVNVAEEIEALGRRDRRELRSRIRAILTQLIKLRASPATAARSGCQETVIEQRAKLRGLLDHSPSLGATLRDVIHNELPVAREQAMAAIATYNERPRVDPTELSFTEDQVRGLWLLNGDPCAHRPP
jgi:hypothetical protein